ncbi:thioredoxin family protein [Litoribacterium kuwaitense]|uniref:thioredoxin family protein n=1 Tax=Litoribacterium kuwaitense TaxID=1398745 RepID=UPI001BA788D5|nr:thioredoxin family protein [Litoribacterium kuwaitense]
MELTDWYEKGTSFSKYVEEMSVNKDALNQIYKHVSFTPEDEMVFQQMRGKGWRGIVLTADWCGDALLNIPIFQRIAEESDITLRFLIRDENLELMDRYLTNGTSRAIPKFIFINCAGEEQFVWGPRALDVQKLVVAEMSSLPPKEDPSFSDKQKQLIMKINERYTSDSSLWRAVIDDIKQFFTTK